MKQVTAENLLKGLDYSVVQQCMHCGMCLPTCPTYDLTKQERHSPRGRIALMRAIADEQLPVTEIFADEMYYCLGCLACKTACPAGVDYPKLFEMARAETERTGVKANPQRSLIRWATLRVLFGRQWLLHALGRVLYIYKNLGWQKWIREHELMRLLPVRLQKMERMTPDIQRHFSCELIQAEEVPAQPKYTVGLLTGCVQDMIYADVNRDTADVLLAADCRVLTPRGQLCCGSLHAHNGDLDLAKQFGRKLLDQFDLDKVDAIITNAGGCGSHLREYGHLFRDDPIYAERATQWSTKLKDIHEWLIEIGFEKVLYTLPSDAPEQRLTYHDSCHLAHGQGITKQPRTLLEALPGVTLAPLSEANWCCGSAGVYNLTQPETAAQLAHRKLDHIAATGCSTVATANPGCLLQLEKFAEMRGMALTVRHPVSLLAERIRPQASPQSG